MNTSAADLPGQDELRASPWHGRRADEVLAALRTDSNDGLTDAEAAQRLQTYGRNRIVAGQATAWWQVLLHQFADPLIYILIIAAGVSLTIAEYVDAAVILVVVLLNAAVGFIQELRARKAISSLASMSAPQARVIRDGEPREIASEDVVPGDILVLDAGMRVAADVRLVEAADLQADESALTGESQPVHKQDTPVDDEDAVPGDQLSMAFAGTSITRGRGRGAVVRTGDTSELGSIAEQTRGMADVQTPITRRMNRLGTAIGIATAVLAVFTVLAGRAAGMPLHELLRTGVALAVAAVPEALPVVLTVTLAVGVRRMAGRHAIIRSLPAVETLGSTTVIASDKTGTLTANELTVKVIRAGGRQYEPGKSEPDEAVRITMLAGVLANETQDPTDGAEDDAGTAPGDPTERALLAAAAQAGIDVDQTRREHPQLDMIPFESDIQLMATLNETPDGRCAYMKGAPEAILERCRQQLRSDGRQEGLDAASISRAADELADEGFRVLAMAVRPGTEGFSDGDPGDGFVFAGLQAMQDSVRPGAVDAVTSARNAGIRVIMLTGDHVRTARSIGRQLGLDSAGALEGRQLENRPDDELDEIARTVDVFARVTPQHKLDLVERLREQGEIVAVTGDGVNDAPALQAAHLGIAMGRAGTDVAREAADMVLADDNFASITNAIEEGRVVFSNIRKVTYFLLSTAVALVLTLLISLFWPWPSAYLPVQVLWINLVTNGMQDVALAFEKGEPGLLDHEPRNPGEGVLNRPVLIRMIAFGVLMTVGTLGTFWWLLHTGAPTELARSVAMTQMVLFQFFHVLNARSFERSVFRIPLSANRLLMVSLPVALLAHLGALYVPALQAIFETAPLTLQHWLLVTVIGASIIGAAEIDKYVHREARA